MYVCMYVCLFGSVYVYIYMDTYHAGGNRRVHDLFGGAKYLEYVMHIST